jgi:two-component system KDP operon response regulator KdpE
MDHDQQKVHGLEMGADDYLVKPFDVQELGARVRAVLRRTRLPREQTESTISVDDVEIDLDRRLVKKCGKLVALTRTEWLLLEHLARNAGRVVLTTELLVKVWGPEYGDEAQNLRVWVSRLRRKLERDRHRPSLIRTRSRMGYVLDPTGEGKMPAKGTKAAAAQA